MAESTNPKYSPDEMRERVREYIDRRHIVPDVLALNNAGVPDIVFDIDKWDGKSIIVAIADASSAVLACALEAIPMPEAGAGGFLILSPSDWKMFPLSFADRIGMPGDDDDDDEDEAIENDPRKTDGTGSPYPRRIGNTGLVMVCNMDKDDRFDTKPSSDHYMRKDFVFRGTPPADFQRAVFSRIACHDASLFYGRDFFIGDKFKRDVRGHRQAKMLMESLTMGHPMAPKFPDYNEEEISRWRRKAIDAIEDVDFAYDESLADDVAAYRFYADLAILWERVMEHPDTPDICARLFWSNLRDERLVNKTMTALGRAVEIESYVDALCKGVPLADIFA